MQSSLSPLVRTLALATLAASLAACQTDVGPPSASAAPAAPQPTVRPAPQLAGDPAPRRRDPSDRLVGEWRVLEEESGRTCTLTLRAPGAFGHGDASTFGCLAIGDLGRAGRWERFGRRIVLSSIGGFDPVATLFLDGRRSMSGRLESGEFVLLEKSGR